MYKERTALEEGQTGDFKALHHPCLLQVSSMMHSLSSCSGSALSRPLSPMPHPLEWRKIPSAGRYRTWRWAGTHLRGRAHQNYIHASLVGLVAPHYTHKYMNAFVNHSYIDIHIYVHTHTCVCTCIRFLLQVLCVCYHLCCALLCRVVQIVKIGIDAREKSVQSVTEAAGQLISSDASDSASNIQHDVQVLASK